MKKLTQILVVLCIPVLMWNCEKEVKYNRVEGTLSPGQDMSRDNLDSVPVVIAKIRDTVDFATVAIDPANFEATGTIMTDASGYFFIGSLPDGNYLVAAGEGFKFADVDYVKIAAADGSVNQVNKTVNRMPLQNGVGLYPLKVINETRFDISKIEFFAGGQSLGFFSPNLEPKGQDCSKYAYFDLWLDPDQWPSIQLSFASKDTLLQSPEVYFFVYYRCPVIDCYAKNRRGEWTASKLTFEKDWFFGHWVRLNYAIPGTGAVLTN